MAGISSHRRAMGETMKGLFRHLAGASEASGDGSLPAQLAVGQVYAFRTSPYSEFAPPETHRHAAFKIVGVDPRYVAVAVLDGIWPAAPGVKETRKASVLHEYRFAHTGRPAIFGVNREFWRPEEELAEVRFVGVQPVTAEEADHAEAIARFAPGSRFGALTHANYGAEGEWRWSREREALVAEAALQEAKSAAERAARDERYRTRLSKLTWEQLLSETPFARWTPSPPFPPEAFTRAAQAVIRDACIALRDLGPKPRRPQVRAILSQAVQWFNTADAQAGGVIETDEREDICAVLEEMAHVARQKALVGEIDEWREW